jgi:hypothetical protein
MNEISGIIADSILSVPSERYVKEQNAFDFAKAMADRRMRRVNTMVHRGEILAVVLRKT